MDLQKLLDSAKNLHANIAKDVWHDGQDMICKICGYELHLTTEQCGYCLAHGWPKHCGKDMRYKTEGIS